MVSIIVPVYNVEKYIRRCLNSIKYQTYKDFEVIIVDDGSTDGSVLICEDFCKEDKRFRLVKKDNGGVSSARNVGIKEAKGELIHFTDSDDCLNDNTIELLVAGLGNADLCISSYTIIKGKRRIEKCLKSIDEFKSIDFRYDFSSYLSMKKSVLINSPCNKIYKKQLICSLFDEKMSIGEDLVFNNKYFMNCLKVNFINSSTYNYYFRKGSATKTINLKRVQNELVLFYEELRFISNYFIGYDIKPFLESYYYEIFDSYLGLISSRLRKRTKIETIKEWNNVLRGSLLVEKSKSNGLECFDFVMFDELNCFRYIKKKYGLFRYFLKMIYNFAQIA